jgi:hypothetical protein
MIHPSDRPLVYLALALCVILGVALYLRTR